MEDKATESSPPLVVAHRGASHDAPENTLAAFAMAWKQGADAIECDVRLTRDGRLVCLHDPTTGRTAEQDLDVAATPLRELRDLDVGRWKHARFAGEPIPVLEEVLAAVPDGRKVFVEIKCGSDCLPVLSEAITRARAAGKVIVVSFNEDVVCRSKVILASVPALLLTELKYNRRAATWEPAASSLVSTLSALGADGADVSHAKGLDEAYAAALRTAGYPLHVWTVNQSRTATHYARMGAASITTDRPALLRRVIDNL